MEANGVDMVETSTTMKDTEYLHKACSKAAKPGAHFVVSQDVLLKLCLSGVSYLKQKY